MTEQSAPETVNEKKKKKGFLGILMRIFIILLILVAVATGVAYWQKQWVTSWVIEKYGQLLATSLTSAENYRINSDPQYEQERPEHANNLNEFQEQIRSTRRQEISQPLLQLAACYYAYPNENWFQMFGELRKKLHGALEDRGVTYEELDEIKKSVQALVDRYPVPEDSPKEKEATE